MRTCETCGTRVFFGRGRFCSEQCRSSGFEDTFAQRVPPQVALEHALARHASSCPLCGGAGPIDLHFSYRGWSAFFVSEWESVARISCLRCASRHQAAAMLYTLLLGPWSIPGPLMTVVQIARNVAALTQPPNPSTPTPAFVARVRFELGSRPIV